MMMMLIMMTTMMMFIIIISIIIIIIVVVVVVIIIIVIVIMIILLVIFWHLFVCVCLSVFTVVAIVVTAFSLASNKSGFVCKQTCLDRAGWLGVKQHQLTN